MPFPGMGRSRWRRVLLFPPVEIVLALLLAFAIGFGIVVLLRVAHVPRSPLRGEGAFAAGAVLALVLTARYVERRRPSEVGLRLERIGPQLAGGAVIGALLMSVVVGVLASAGWYRVRDASFDAGVLAHGIVLYALVALYEESVSRGVVFRIIEERWGSWWALGVSSVLFGAGHLGNTHATILAAFSITVTAGLMLGAAFMLTRTIWVAVGLHWTWNLFEGTVYGTPVSGMSGRTLVDATVGGPRLWTGGRFGPEAGLVVLLTGTAAGVLLLRAAYRRGRVVRGRRRAALSPGP